MAAHSSCRPVLRCWIFGPQNREIFFLLHCNLTSFLKKGERNHMETQTKNSANQLSLKSSQLRPSGVFSSFTSLQFRVRVSHGPHPQPHNRSTDGQFVLRSGNFLLGVGTSEIVAVQSAQVEARLVRLNRIQIQRMQRMQRMQTGDHWKTNRKTYRHNMTQLLENSGFTFERWSQPQPSQS